MRFHRASTTPILKITQFFPRTVLALFQLRLFRSINLPSAVYTVWSSKSKGPVTVSALIVPQHGQGLSELAPSVAFPQVSYSALSQPPSSAYMRVFQVIHCSLPSKDRISPQAPKAASGYWDCSALAATP